jgi:hypothetical protein
MFDLPDVRFTATYVHDEKLVFNDELSGDLLWLDGYPALHVVDTATRFGEAVFLEVQDVEHVWAAFLL